MSDFLIVEPYHNPNEGRDIINYNFSLINNALTGVSSGNSVVLAGSNVNVTSGGTSPVYFTVNLNTGVTVTSLSATTLYSGSTDLSLIFGAGSNTYTNSGATPTTIGGIAAGSTFASQTMTNMFDALLYPYQTPAFTSFSIAGQTTPIEVGNTVAGGSRTFTWATSNSSNVSANTIAITDNSSGITLSSGLSNDGTEAITLTATTRTTASSHVWGISATNSQSTSFSSTFTVSWRYKVYYGTSSNTSLTSGQITGLTSSALSTSFAGTFSYAAGDYKYFTFPDSFGSASTFKDSSTNLDVAMADSSDGYTLTANGLFYQLVSVTNLFGVVANYKVYRTKNILGSTINIIIT